MTMTTKDRDRMLEGIAKRALNIVFALRSLRITDIPTLTARKSDSLDFHEVSVWGLLEALRLAYSAGYEQAITDRAAL